MKTIPSIAFPPSNRTGEFSPLGRNHGDLLNQRIQRREADSSRCSNRLLAEIQNRYIEWQRDNEALRGPFSQPGSGDGRILAQRADLLNAYKDFVDERRFAEAFPSGTRLHSSVMREFICYLFRDLVAELPVAGTNPHSVVIECKTYLDKTMLEGASTAAEQLKSCNPNALYLVVSEWLKLTENVNLRKYKVDQIYVLRKQKNTDREFRYLPDYQKNPIYVDVVEHLFNTVRTHLPSDWEGGLAHGLEKGILL
jgi:Bpu10I restriction endonuclease